MEMHTSKKAPELRRTIPSDMATRALCDIVKDHITQSMGEHFGPKDVQAITYLGKLLKWNMITLAKRHEKKSAAKQAESLGKGQKKTKKKAKKKGGGGKDVPILDCLDMVMDMFYTQLAPRRQRLLPSPKADVEEPTTVCLQMLFVGDDRSIRVDTTSLLIERLLLVKEN